MMNRSEFKKHMMKIGKEQYMEGCNDTLKALIETCDLVIDQYGDGELTYSDLKTLLLNQLEKNRTNK